MAVMLSNAIKQEALNSFKDLYGGARDDQIGKVISNQVKVLLDTTPELIQTGELSPIEKQKRKAAVVILSVWNVVPRLKEYDKDIISKNLQPSDGNNQLRKIVGLPELGYGGRRRKTHKRRKTHRRKSRKN